MSARSRILDAADRLFTEQGIRSVGVDAIVAAAGTAKTTLYAHFGSKDGLVVAHLQRRAERQRERLERGVAAHGGGPVERILHLYDLLAVECAQPGYRGSPFANARVELGDDHPAAAVAAEHRGWLLGTFTDLVIEGGAPDPAAVPAQLLLLHEAAAQAGGDAARTARAAAEALLAAPHHPVAPTPGTDPAPGAPHHPVAPTPGTDPARGAPHQLLAPTPGTDPARGAPHELLAPASGTDPARASSHTPQHVPGGVDTTAPRRTPAAPGGGGSAEAPAAPQARLPADDGPDAGRSAPPASAGGRPAGGGQDADQFAPLACRLRAGGSAAAHRLVAFLNSAHLPDGDDQLADERAAAWIADWLAAAGRPAPPALGEHPTTTAAPAELLVVREGLRELAALNCGARPDPHVVAEAAAWLERAPVLVDVAGGAEPRLTPADPVDHAGPTTAAARLVVAVVAGDYLAVRARGEWSRVKVCGSPDCRWAFVDTTRNRSRRWCDMAGCGNRAKNRAWRHRQTLVTA